MSATFDWESELDADNDGPGTGAGNNDGMAELRRAYKALKNELKQANEELSTFKVQARQSAIRDTLQAKGVNPKIAAFVPADIEPTEEAVTKWVLDYADVFGIQVEDQAAEGVPATEAANLQQIQQFTQGGATPPNRRDNLQARIAAATTREELEQILAEAG